MIKKFLLTTCLTLSSVGMMCAQTAEKPGDTFTADDGITYRIKKITSGSEAGSTSKTTVEWGGGNKSIITTTENWSGTNSNIYDVEPISLGSSTSVSINNWTKNLGNTDMLGVGDSDNTYNYKDQATEYNKNVTKLRPGYFTLTQVKGMGVTSVFQNGATKNPNVLSDTYKNTVYYYTSYYDDEDDYMYETYWMITDIQVKKTVTGVKNNEINYVVKTFDASLIDSNISSLTIGSTVTGHTGNFGNAEGLTSITSYSSAYEVVNEDRNVFLYNAGKTVLLYTSASDKTITLPGTVTSIATGALAHCQKLVIKASGIKGNPALEGTNNILHKNEAILNGYEVTGFINQAAFDAISFEEGQSYDFRKATIEGSIDATAKINAKNNLILFFAEGADVTADKNVVIDGTCSNLVLEDGVVYNNTVAEFNATTATYNRTLAADKWGTMVIPFPVNNMEEGVLAAELTDVDENKFYFTSSQIITANRPVMIYSQNGSTSFTGTGRVLKSNAATKYSVKGKTDSFVGTYSSYAATAEGDSVYYGYYSSVKEFRKMNSTNTVTAYRASIKTTAGSSISAPSFRLIDEFTGTIEEITANITDIDIINVEEANEAIYTLDGKKANALNQNGVIIKNGKKTIKK